MNKRSHISTIFIIYPGEKAIFFLKAWKQQNYNTKCAAAAPANQSDTQRTCACDGQCLIYEFKRVSVSVLCRNMLGIRRYLSLALVISQESAYRTCYMLLAVKWVRAESRHHVGTAIMVTFTSRGVCTSLTTSASSDENTRLWGPRLNFWSFPEWSLCRKRCVRNKQRVSRFGIVPGSRWCLCQHHANDNSPVRQCQTEPSLPTALWINGGSSAE